MFVKLAEVLLVYVLAISQIHATTLKFDAVTILTLTEFWELSSIVYQTVLDILAANLRLKEVLQIDLQMDCLQQPIVGYVIRLGKVLARDQLLEQKLE